MSLPVHEGKPGLDNERHLRLMPGMVGSVAVERAYRHLSPKDPVERTIAEPELLADGQRILEAAYDGMDHGC